MKAPALIRFSFAGVSWELLVYETTDRHGETHTRVAAYCLEDPSPRGPRRAWTLANGLLTPWEPRPEGDWPELDVVARLALDAAEEALDASVPRRSA